jgi:hypothetical protein
LLHNTKDNNKGMLFSYCKRTSDNAATHVPYNYLVNPLQTPQGFAKDPAMCPGLNVPHVYNRGIPNALFDKETEIRGQGRAFQPYCANPCENNQLDFSLFKWMQDAPMAKVGQPIPCAPTPVIEVKQYGPGGCGVSGCGVSGCGTVPCGCQEHPFGLANRGMTKPQIGQIGMNITGGCKF